MVEVFNLDLFFSLPGGRRVLLLGGEVGEGCFGFSSRSSSGPYFSGPEK